METLMTQQTVSMSEFKRNPASVLRSANRRPVAVLSHNKAAFYMVEPALFEAMLEQMADRDLENLVRSRLDQKAQAISVDIDTV
jgi:antitoxin StbD